MKNCFNADEWFHDGVTQVPDFLDSHFNIKKYVSLFFLNVKNTDSLYNICF